MLRHPEVSSEQRPGGGRTEEHEHPGAHDRELLIEPWLACADLRRVGLAVNAPLAARLPLEVLHDVRDVGVASIDPRRDQALVEQLPRGADERLARAILGVAGLLADEHDTRMACAGAEDRLRAG